MYTVYPWIHQYNNNKTREGQLESCMFPDRNPNNLPADSQFSMAAGDFLEIYTEPGNHLLVWWKKFGRDQCTVMWVKFVGVEGLGLWLYFLTNAYRYVSVPDLLRLFVHWLAYKQCIYCYFLGKSYEVTDGKNVTIWPLELSYVLVYVQSSCKCIKYNELYEIEITIHCHSDRYHGV